jgi:hypothetical protein
MEQPRERKTWLRSLAMRPSTKAMLEKVAKHYDRTPADTIEFLIRDECIKLKL